MNVLPMKQMPMMQWHNARMLRRQRGIVLFLSLVLLLLITVLGLGSMQTASLQEKMVAGTRDHMTAFQSAEAALNRGRTYITSIAGSESGFSSTCANGLCNDSLTSSWTSTMWKDDTNTWVDAKSVKITNANAHVAGNPRYFIRHIGDFDPPSTGQNYNVENYQATQAPKKISYYTVYARGVGLSKDTYVYIEGNFGRQF